MLRRLVAPAAAVMLLALSSPAPADASEQRFPGFPCLSEPLVHADGDIVDVAVSNPDFSTLVAAVTAAGLVDTLRGPGPFTVFAPTNAAFAGLPPFLLSAALSDPGGLLTTILTYHVAGRLWDPRFFFLPWEIPTVQGQGVFLSASRRTSGVNQSNINCQGVRATNGLIWIIDSVLLPQFPPAE